MEITGRPLPEDIKAINSSLASTMLESLPPTKAKPLRQFFPAASDDALDLIKRLLHFNPNKRLTAEEALAHPYVAQFHNLKDESVCSKVISIPMDDDRKFSIREYRNKIY
jgi:mitogen-activated protein kinase 15